MPTEPIQRLTIEDTRPFLAAPCIERYMRFAVMPTLAAVAFTSNSLPWKLSFGHALGLMALVVLVGMIGKRLKDEKYAQTLSRITLLKQDARLISQTSTR